MRIIGILFSAFFAGAVAFRSPAPSSSVARRSFSLKMATERITAMQAMMDFNRDFKAGLKFILVPQYELKEKAKAARIAKEKLENNLLVDAAEVPSSSILTPDEKFATPDVMMRAETLVPSDNLATVGTSGIPTVDTFASGSNDALPNAASDSSVLDTVGSRLSDLTSGMSIPDINILRETLAKALPDKSALEISDITNKLAQITASVQERTQQLARSDVLKDLRTEMSDVTGLVSGKYQEVVPYVKDLTGDIAERLGDNYQQALPYVKDLTDDIAERLEDNYQQALPYVKEITKEMSGLSDVLNERYQEALPYVKDLTKDMPDVSGILGARYQQALLDSLSTDTDPSKVLSELKERMLSMEVLQVRGEDMPEISFVTEVPFDKLEAVFDRLNQLIQTDGWTLPDLLQILNYQELGGWYSGAIVGIFLIASLLVKSKTPPVVLFPNREKRATTSSVRSQPGGAAALNVELVEERIRLESLVSDLTLAVTALSKELRELKVDKERTEYALAAMKSDVTTLQNAMEVTGVKERDLRDQALENVRQETDLKVQLQEAEIKVQTLELEKLSLQNEIKTLAAKRESVKEDGVLPNPPSTPPPAQMLTSRAKDSVVWFANFVSNNAS